jgi:hypothetical protein
MAKTKRTLGVNIEGEDLDQLRAIAERERRSISFLIREVVHEFLQRHNTGAAATSAPAKSLQPTGPSEAGGAPSNLARSLFTAAANLDQLATAAWRERIAPEELGNPPQMLRRQASIHSEDSDPRISSRRST